MFEGADRIGDLDQGDRRPVTPEQGGEPDDPTQKVPRDRLPHRDRIDHEVMSRDHPSRLLASRGAAPYPAAEVKRESPALATSALKRFRSSASFSTQPRVSATSSSSR